MNLQRKARTLLVVGLSLNVVGLTVGATLHSALTGGFLGGVGTGLLTMTLMVSKRRCAPPEAA